MLTIANLSGILGNMFRHLYSFMLCYSCRKKRASIKPNDSKKEDNDESINKENSESIEIMDNSEKKKKGKNIRDDVSVPLVVVILIICLYIYIGANIFNSTENWSMVTASYFSFITFATIGFGDFVPGLKEVNHHHEVSIGLSTIICAIYVLFGMAIIAMCFDLIQEGFVKRIYWLIKKIDSKKKQKKQAKLQEKVNTLEKTQKNSNADFEMKELSNDIDFASINLSSTNSTFIRSENSLLSANSGYSRSNLRVNPHTLALYRVKTNESESKQVKELTQVSC